MPYDPFAEVRKFRSRNNTGLTRPGCRLDYFLISKELCGRTSGHKIMSDVVISDHFVRK